MDSPKVKVDAGRLNGAAGVFSDDLMLYWTNMLPQPS